MHGKHKKRSGILTEILIAEDILFKDEKKRAWATCNVNGVKQHLLIEGEEYGLRISKVYLDNYDCGIQAGETKSIIATLKAQAIHYGDTKKTHLRVAQMDGKIYYDLSNESNEMVEVDQDGYRVISANDEIIFERYRHQIPQKHPTPSDKLKIGKYVNISKSDSLLFSVYIVSLFIPDIQHPILVLYGESGRGKSTISKIVKRIADPSHTNLFMPTKNVDDLYLTMAEHWVVAFDNISKIVADFSDILCAITTGISQSKRKLYTDSEMCFSNANSCIILNGIENNATRRDLLSRSILFEVREKGKIRASNELMNEFENDIPEILGRIFQLISDALRIYPSIRFADNFRMAEFAKWGYALAEAMGGRGEEFLTEYRANVKKQEAETIASNTLVLAIQHLMTEIKRDEWRGRPSDLLRELRRIGINQELNMRSDTMPTSAPLLTKKLNANKGVLKSVGIEYSHIGHKNNGAQVIIKKL